VNYKLFPLVFLLLSCFQHPLPVLPSGNLSVALLSESTSPVSPVPKTPTPGVAQDSLSGAEEFPDSSRANELQPTDSEAQPENKKPLLIYSDDKLSVNLHFPHGTKETFETFKSAILREIPVLPDSVLSPGLASITDDSLKSVLRTMLLDEIPSALLTYQLKDVSVTDSSTIISFAIDTSNLYRRTEPLIAFYKDPASAPLYPLFSMDTNPPGPEIYSRLSLLIPCEGIPVPRRALLLPNAPRSYRNGIHRGIDFYANWGTPVRAVADGVIIRAEHNYKEVLPEFRKSLLAETDKLGRTPSDIFEHILVGRAVYIDHGFSLVPGYRAVTIYAHLSDIENNLNPGTKVTRGQIIGYSGNSGTSDSTKKTRNGAHLHWELIVQNKAGEYYLGQGLNYDELFPLLVRIFASEDE